MHPEVRHGVEEEHGGAAHDGHAVVDGSGGDHEPEVGHGNAPPLGGPEDGAHGVEVALGTPPLALLQAVLAGGNVEDEVRLPAEQLVGYQADERDDGRILEEIGVDAQLSEEAVVVVLLGARHESHVLLHVAREAVVARMRELPREEGHHQERVCRPAHDAVDAAVQREGAVAALVRDDPETRADEALDEAVGHPRRNAQPLVLNRGDVGQRGVGERRDAYDVARKVGERDPQRRAEAVRGNGVTESVDVGILDGTRLLHRLLLLWDIHVSYTRYMEDGDPPRILHTFAGPVFATPWAPSDSSFEAGRSHKAMAAMVAARDDIFTDKSS